MTESNAHFRSVLRGYDPAQVDQLVHELTQAAAAARQEAGERTIQVSKLEAAHGQLRTEVERHAQHARALEDAQKNAAAPTFAGLGERIGSILELADKEASEMRTRAQSDAANHHALADESALAVRRSADDYATETRSAVDSEVARILEDAKRHADSLLDDADRESMARREEAEAVYERARAKSAASAVDFETTLAARREASALELVAEIGAAEQQLAAVQARAEQIHNESEQAQQEAASRTALQLEQATAQAVTLVAEAKTKAERIRGDSERELAAATQRRDSINAQLTNVRQMLATLGGVAMVAPLELADVPAVDDNAGAKVEPTEPATDTQGAKASAPAQENGAAQGSTTESTEVEPVADADAEANTEAKVDDKASESNNSNDKRNHSGHKVGVKR
jgi:DivIVA domain-containing protein